MIDLHWHELLHSWSRYILATTDFRDVFLREVIDPNSPLNGQPGRNRKQIARAEQRLILVARISRGGIPEITNGWPAGGLFLTRILPVEEIEWVFGKKKGLVGGLETGFEIWFGKQ